MQSTVFATAAQGGSVLVSETQIERLQLVGRVGQSTFLLGGSRDADGMTSGPNPYDLMSASLAACTIMTIRMFAERRKIALGRIQVSVAHQRGSAGARDAFERVIILDGDVSEKHRAAMLKLADLCPVGKTRAGRGHPHRSESDRRKRCAFLELGLCRRRARTGDSQRRLVNGLAGSVSRPTA